MKTKEELNIIKEEVETLNKKLAELTDEELDQVTGGLEYKITFIPVGCFVSQPDIDKDLKPEQALQTYKNLPHYRRTHKQDQEQVLQTYKKDIGSDKNAKIIY